MTYNQSPPVSREAGGDVYYKTKANPGYMLQPTWHIASSVMFPHGITLKQHTFKRRTDTVCMSKYFVNDYRTTEQMVTLALPKRNLANESGGKGCVSHV